MKYKSEHITYNGEEVEFRDDWVLFVKVKDPTQVNWFRILEKTFKDWNEVMWADKITLAALYEDVFPEFIWYDLITKEIKFNQKEFLKYCPDTKLTFTLTDDDIFSKQVKKKISTKVKCTKTIKPKKRIIDSNLLIEIEKRLYNKIYAKVYSDLIEEFKISTISNERLLNLKNIIQLDKKWDVINYFFSASEAGQKLKIASSSISAVLNWKRKSAGGFIFINNNTNE